MYVTVYNSVRNRLEVIKWSGNERVSKLSVSRARPVLLGAGTTVLGVAPLLPDVFWNAMAITIMAGLSVGTVMTLLAVPALYAVFYRVKAPSGATA